LINIITGPLGEQKKMIEKRTQRKKCKLKLPMEKKYPSLC